MTFSSELIIGIVGPVAGLGGGWIGASSARKSNRDANKSAELISLSAQKHAFLLEERRAARSAREMSYPRIAGQVQFATSKLISDTNIALSHTYLRDDSAEQTGAPEFWVVRAKQYDAALAWDSAESLLSWGQLVVFSSADTEKAWGDWIAAINANQKRLFELVTKVVPKSQGSDPLTKLTEGADWDLAILKTKNALRETKSLSIETRAKLFDCLRHDWSKFEFPQSTDE